MTQHFDRRNIDFLKTAQTYQKRALTRAVRIDGPFEVTTSQGKCTCDDGYLALGSDGWPYAIGVEEFEFVYVRIGFMEKESSR